ncbi:MAG: type I restriction endonuclease subunit R [Anaeromyxobacter sp.]|nr:type I restriction endonuclease subunit R [Anaeromyxobacter sp.]
MAHAVAESDVEDLALQHFANLGYAVINGPKIEPEGPAAERERFEEVVLRGRLEAALRRLNPGVPAPALDEALRKLLNPELPSLLRNNQAVHQLLRDGIEVDVAAKGGEVRGVRVRLVDFDDADKNDWLAVNQFTVVEGHANRRPDVVVFLNGLPVAVLELKNAAAENATTQAAFQQLQTYKKQIPALFTYNALLVISDGMQARVGTLTSNWERFAPWRTIDGDVVAHPGSLELSTLLDGIFEQQRFLDLLRSFVVFEDDHGDLIKKLAGYHQFHAVRTAVDETVRATRPGGDRKVGVVWHTQGSGKSLTMAFYAGKVILDPAMENPTLVVITDRNDLDDQLFGTFARCHELLRQKPVQAKDRDDLTALLRVAAGGVIFTTIQKFLPEEVGERFPPLSTRRNIVVVADEAHRSQYGFRSRMVAGEGGGQLVAGFAQHMRDALPNASFIGFTGTPVEKTDANTRSVFGDYISVYDIQRAVQDGATVPIFYESRLAKLTLRDDQKPVIDKEFEEVTEAEEDLRKDRLRSKWAALEAVVGEEKRIQVVAEDLVRHFENRVQAIDGKGMIVAMSRRICVDMYDAIVKLRPDWGDADDTKGAIKVVMTGSASDPEAYQPHLRSKLRLKDLADRFKDPDDPLKLVIVRDMWLTGFDAPCLHTLYVDKPMQGHGLMQAIARVNRVFRDKPGGLVVDYLGLADALKSALATYTEAGGEGSTALDQAEAVAVLLEKVEVCRDIFHGFDYSKFLTGEPADRLRLLPPAQQHILALEDGRDRFVKAVMDLVKAFALAVPHDRALEIRDEVAFMQAVKAAVVKSTTGGSGKTDAEMDHAIRQIVSKAISADGVVDIFAAAGLKQPDLGILSEEFLAEVKGMPQRNLAVELLRKLLNDDLKIRKKKNLVQSEAFSEKLEKTILKYRNRAIETVQVIEELIRLAKEMREAQARGAELKLTDDEVAFYDALETSDSAVKVLGDEVLAKIARELTETIRNSVTIDWTVRENVRAQIRVRVRRLLAKYGYPPDKREKAVETVLKQAELLAAEWAA